ncbi:hypothetical protein [Oceanobacter mangrovi]|uniref:hypothetical protein n=1 Tax=Oceanobacter mangrovi TaxID=2862510 RepID=UPI001C8D35AB|nr:hypothetical protein [Oceanobacter mangrovi]
MLQRIQSRLLTCLLLISGLLLVHIVAAAPAASEQQPSKTAEPVISVPLWGWVDNQPVYQDEARFWLNYVERQQQKLEAQELVSQADHAMPDHLQPDQQAASYICQQRHLRQLASQHGVAISAADDRQYQQQQQQNIGRYGGGYEYFLQLRRMYQSEAMYHWLFNSDRLAERLFEKLYGSRAEKAPANTVARFVAERQLVYGLWLRQPASASAEQQQQFERLAGLLAAMPAEQRLSELQKLLQQYPDPLLKGYRNGRLLNQGLLPTSVASWFRQGSNQPVQENRLSAVITTPDDDRYLVLQLPLQASQSVNNSNRSLRYWATREQLFRPMIEQGCESPAVKLASVP